MIKHKNLKNFILFLGFSALVGTSFADQKPVVFTKNIQVKHVGKEDKSNTVNLPIVNIWIHGTCLPFGVRTFQAPPLGMWKAADLAQKNKHLDKIATLLSQKDPENFSYNNFYFFGWSGELGFEQREKSSEILYSEIKKIIRDYIAEYSVSPTIRLICHSHGGNVALNIAQHASKDYSDESVSIDELVLLGCPIQAVTKDYAHKFCIFKRVYNIYSTIDLIQILDPQGIYEKTKNYLKNIQNKKDKLFSGKKLAAQNHIAQGYVSINNRPILHAEFVMPHFVETLPELLASLKESFAQKSPAIYALSVKK